MQPARRHSEDTACGFLMDTYSQVTDKNGKTKTVLEFSKPKHPHPSPLFQDTVDIADCLAIHNVNITTIAFVIKFVPKTGALLTGVEVKLRDKYLYAVFDRPHSNQELVASSPRRLWLWKTNKSCIAP